MLLHILNKEFTINDLKNGNFSLEGDEFIDNVLIFCFEWLNGKEAFSMQSSGSTGTPKTITVKRQQMYESAKATGAILKLQRNDTALICMNTDYIAGKMMLVRMLELKLDTWIVPPTSTPFKEHQFPVDFDFTAMAPIQVQLSLEDVGSKDRFLNTKKLIIGGAPMAESQEDEIILQMVNTKVYMTYGMTETVSHIALREVSATSDQLYHTLNNVLIGVDHRNCLNITAPMTDNKKIQTNDIVKIISSTSFQWIGRADNIINSGGVKVQAEKVEKATLHHLFDLGYHNINLFVGGVPNDLLGEEVTLFIEGVSLSAEDEHQLLLKLKNELGRYELPKKVVSVGSFVKTNTLKIQRKQTIKQYLDATDA
ncbi:AMP-binding protein [Flammeovirga agarivorans]|uniref:AMP-binding protein n=1 Tax=Flammeovirga agarivorans TaxID=2726742 RepID=A0A7X8SJ83_9BACT|nr:AMP-binding protein [Flammeovirga agarivorans]NLR91132.1 AMP-binding protein [Flammeovirga agarivorans]